MANPGLENVDPHSQAVADRENGATKGKIRPGGQRRRVLYSSVNDSYKDAVARLRASKSADFARSRRDYDKRTDLSEDEKDKRAYADLVALGLHKPTVKVAPKGKSHVVAKTPVVEQTDTPQAKKDAEVIANAKVPEVKLVPVPETGTTNAGDTEEQQQQQTSEQQTSEQEEQSSETQTKTQPVAQPEQQESQTPTKPKGYYFITKNAALDFVGEQGFTNIQEYVDKTGNRISFRTDPNSTGVFGSGPGGKNGYFTPKTTEEKTPEEAKRTDMLTHNSNINDSVDWTYNPNNNKERVSFDAIKNIKGRLYSSSAEMREHARKLGNGDVAKGLQVINEQTGGTFGYRSGPSGNDSDSLLRFNTQANPINRDFANDQIIGGTVPDNPEQHYIPAHFTELPNGLIKQIPMYTVQNK